MTALDSLVELATMELIERHSLDEIEASLEAEGLSPQDALKLTLFIPSAFAREHFEPEGISFPDEFFVGESEPFETRCYVNEPIYQRARALARRWIDENRLSLVSRVLDWSSEADCVKQARAKGLSPTRIGEIHHGLLE